MVSPQPGIGALIGCVSLWMRHDRWAFYTVLLRPNGVMRTVIGVRVKSFSEIAPEFERRVARDVCCNMATVDSQGRVRSRVIHPLWERTTALVLSLASSPKVKHVLAHPLVSLAYIGDQERPAYAECRASWIDDTEEVGRVWQRFRESPLGYDPEPFYAEGEAGVIRLTAWRIQVDDADGESLIWERSDD